MKRLKALFKLLFAKKYILVTQEDVRGCTDTQLIMVNLDVMHQWLKEQDYYCHFEVSKNYVEIMNLE